MAHQSEFSAEDSVVQPLSEAGLSQISEAVCVNVNHNTQAAMRFERPRAIEAELCWRTERRRGYANDLKPKTVNTLGAITFDVP